MLLMSPGPNVLAVMGTSMRVSRSASIALGMGVAGGTLFWSCLTVFGVTNIVTTYAWSMGFLKVFGGLYLLLLAYKSIKLACNSQVHELEHLADRSLIKYFARGFILNISNPKAAFGWIALVSLGISPNSPIWVSIILIVSTVVTSIIFHVLYAVLFSTKPLINLYRKVGRWIHGIFGALFLYAGLRILSTRT